jgi:peptidoglycan/xylan/chitin deacetylase (PgdA/CDA1 family)
MSAVTNPHAEEHEQSAADEPRPYVSVVIPAYNEELWLERCIRALQRQQTAVPYEIIVVDNNSTDSTAEIAQRLGVRYVFEPRQGLTFARQAGEDAARGEIVAHTDADSEAPPDWIERIAREFQHRPDVAVVSGPICFPRAPLAMQIVAPLQNLWVWIWWLVTRRLAVLNGCNFAVLAILKPYGRARRLGVKMKTSGRRFHGQGTFSALFFYARQQMVAALGRERFMSAPDIRMPDGWAVEMRRRRRAALALLPAVPVLALAGCGAYMAISPTSQVYGKIVLHGPEDQKVVALTFDDGPNEPYTSEILDVLDQEGVKATFFTVGVNVATYPDVARRIVTDGNVIANHSWDHSRLASAVDFRYSQLQRTQDEIQSVTGVVPRFFRPPAGIHTPWQLKRVTSSNMVTVNWDAEGFDWMKPNSPERIEQKVLASVRPGSIVLLHDGDETRHGSDRSQTVAALPVIIETLRAEGYRFVTLPELLGQPAYQSK